MDNLTLGQISNILKFAVEFVGIVATIIIALKKIIKKQFDPINKNMDELEKLSVKSDLVNFINDVEMVVFKTHIQKLIAHELYDRYCEKGGNSYVREHWERLKKEGKI